MKKRYATTFAGSEFNENSYEYKKAIRLGEFLAGQGYIVKCGGYYELMEAVAKGVQKAKCECIGITNRSFDPQPANKFITTKFKVHNLLDCLCSLISESELFVVQVGSIGTLAEYSLVWCLKFLEKLPNTEIFLIETCWKTVLGGLKNLNIKPEFFSYITTYETSDYFMKERNS